jgi:hypothetical protein
MSNQADSIALSPLMFGETFLAGAAAMQQQIADSMLAAFDAAADAMNESLRASVKLVDDIGHAETPADIAAAGYSWLQGRVEKGFGWLLALGERLASRSGAPVPQAALPAPIRRAAMLPQRAAMLPQEDIRMPTKPLADKVRPAPIVLARTAKKPARPTAK